MALADATAFLSGMAVSSGERASARTLSAGGLREEGSRCCGSVSGDGAFADEDGSEVWLLFAFGSGAPLDADSGVPLSPSAVLFFLREARLPESRPPNTGI